MPDTTPARFRPSEVATVSVSPATTAEAAVATRSREGSTTPVARLAGAEPSVASRVTRLTAAESTTCAMAGPSDVAGAVVLAGEAAGVVTRLVSTARAPGAGPPPAVITTATPATMA